VRGVERDQLARCEASRDEIAPAGDSRTPARRSSSREGRSCRRPSSSTGRSGNRFPYKRPGVDADPRLVRHPALARTRRTRSIPQLGESLLRMYRARSSGRELFQPRLRPGLHPSVWSPRVLRTRAGRRQVPDQSQGLARRVPRPISTSGQTTPISKKLPSVVVRYRSRLVGRRSDLCCPEAAADPDPDGPGISRHQMGEVVSSGKLLRRLPGNRLRPLGGRQPWRHDGCVLQVVAADEESRPQTHGRGEDRGRPAVCSNCAKGNPIDPEAPPARDLDRAEPTPNWLADPCRRSAGVALGRRAKDGAEIRWPPAGAEAGATLAARRES